MHTTTTYFLKYSYFKQSIDFVWATKYGVSGILNNDIDALLSRITFVQARKGSHIKLLICEPVFRNKNHYY